MLSLYRKFRQFLGRHPALMVAAVVAFAYFVIQCTQITQYGVTWDEPLHRNWGKLFVHFWDTGDRRFIEAMPGYGMFYGPLYFVINFLVSEALYASGLVRFVAANHLLNLLMSSFGVGLTYILGHQLGGKRVGLLTAFFLVCFPQFIAHSHYNPKDIPLMVFIVLTSVLFIHGIKQDSRKYLLASAFFLGVSVGFKVSAILMIPSFALTYAVVIFKNSRSASASLATVFKRELKTVLIVIVLGIAGLLFAWPTAWGDLSLIPRAIKFFGQGVFWPGKVLYFGHEYGGAELPWYYIPLEYVFGMPVLWMLCTALGTVVIFINTVRRRGDWPVTFFIILWIAVPLLATIKPGLVRYDGMRQFYFVLPALALTAALGFRSFVEFIITKTSFKRSALAFFLVLLVSFGAEIAIIHPFEGSYRNELVRLKYPSDMDHVFQLEYWGATYKQGMDWLIANADPNPVICVPTAGILVTWYPWREDFAFECSPQSTYIMFFTRYSEEQQNELLREEPALFTIERYNSVLLKIYKVK